METSPLAERRARFPWKLGMDGAEGPAMDGPLGTSAGPLRFGASVAARRAVGTYWGRAASWVGEPSRASDG
jgi:hypothetical protein